MFVLLPAVEDALERGLGSQFEQCMLFGRISELLRVYGEGEGHPLEIRRLPSGLCEVCAESHNSFGTRGVLFVFDDSRRPFAVVGACCYYQPQQLSA